MSPFHANGRCLCNGVRFEISGLVRNLCYCHCESCRRAVGAPFVAWGTVDADVFKVVAGHLSIVNSSKNVTRGFCEKCGSSLTYQEAMRSGEIDFTLVSLDDPSRCPPEMHIWVKDKLSWVQLDDALPQYQTVMN